MKVDVPEHEAWRRKRADELEGTPPEPWYMRQARAGLVAGGIVPSKTRTDVRPLVSSTVASVAQPPSAPVAEVLPPPVPKPDEQSAAAPAGRGGVARGAAVVAAMLFAAAAGWQVRDLLDTPQRPVIEESRPVAAPVAAPIGPLAPQCDDPRVAERLRALVAAQVGADGGGADWIARIGSAPITVAPPRVTVVNADGGRFCGTTLTIVPPGANGAPIDAAVTYTVGATGDGRDVTALQGVVPLVRRLVDLGRPSPKAVEPVATQAVSPPSVVRAPAKTDAVSRAKTAPATRQASTLRPTPEKSTPPAKATATAPPGSPAKVAASLPVSNVCDDVVSRAEAIVCATPALTRLDRELSATLDRVDAGDTKLAKKIADGQRRFLARRDRCTTEACIADRYSDRLDDIAKTEARLRKEAERVRSLPPCKGFEVYRPVRPCRVGG